ncbi:ODV-EC43 [Betabaculovirus altermyunipunctae]|uniref:ODV-EC43 n=1 Tax=Betabaculovirus altermyunipunctae TaxID=3051996 RepID=A0A1S5YEC9_9BBAC|nr:ODV-EC43 [Betabaculovirus altermyunipunctae]AQQ80317.1 ODV-EC43 [Betabaculovirus altermyunipunctae]
MTCPANVKVYISDAYVQFPYSQVPTAPRDAGGGGRVLAVTVFVPTFEDVTAVNTTLVQRQSGYTDVRVEKHTAQDHTTTDSGRVVVYWNVIGHINRLGLGETRVFSVVLSDNLFLCEKVEIVSAPPTSCPMQIEYSVCNTTDCVLVGESPSDHNVLQSIATHNQLLIHFRRETPMGIKILNIKRFLIMFGMRSEPVKFSIYMPHDDLAIVQKELTWENTRRVLRGGASNLCRAYNLTSVKYVLDALELLGIRRDNVSSVHNLVEIFSPLVLRYRIVPDVFLHMNHLTKRHKHVRLYCDGDSLAVSPGGIVPVNRLTHNPKTFEHDPLAPPPERFYMELGTRDIYVQVPKYNYFL